MKRIIILLLLLMPIFAFGQKIAENEIDEFTHDRIIRTSWEPLSTQNFRSAVYSYFRICKINNIKYFELKAIVGGNSILVPQGEKFMFKLNNDSIITVYNIKQELSCTACGELKVTAYSQQGVDVRYLIEDNQINAMLKNKVAKIRFYDIEGYTDQAVKDDDAVGIINSLNLIEDCKDCK